MVGEFLFVLTIVGLFVVPPQSAGVTISNQAKQAFLELKVNQKYHYVIYYITEKKEIDVDFTGDRDATLEDFLLEIINLRYQCRYLIYDKTVESRHELTLIKWIPENAEVNQNSLYNSGYEVIKCALVGVDKYIQATNLEAVEKALKSSGS